MRDQIQLVLLTCFAMLAFAANSFFSRIALVQTDIDPTSFTFVRLVSGAIVLWFIVSRKKLRQPLTGNWRSAFALFVYAGAFSFAYIELETGLGALVLFGVVQITMISFGLFNGEKIHRIQWIGFLIAILGFTALTLPGASSPPILEFSLMMLAGIAWGVYSILGRSSKNPLITTAGNFIRSVPFVIVLSLIFFNSLNIDFEGALYAFVSGAIASGVGYSVWYRVLPYLESVTASSVQLSVPVLAAIFGILFLDENINFRFILCAIAILGGVFIVIVSSRKTTEKLNAD